MPVEPRPTITRERSSLRTRIRLVLVAIIIILAVVQFPAARWYVLISVGIGVIAAVILHFWNKRPVKLEEDEVRLHLMDDEDEKTRKSS